VRPSYIAAAILLNANLFAVSAHAEALASFLADDAQFHVIGDPDHGSLPHYGFRASEAFILAITEADIKKVFIEIPRKFQPLFDEIYQGTIDADGFAHAYYAGGARSTGVGADDQLEAAKLTGEMAQKLGRRKIKTIAFDTTGLIAPDEGGTGGKRLDPIYSCLLSEGVGVGRALDPLYEERLAQARWRERLAEDALLADDIKKVADGDKSVILIGALHLATGYALDRQMHARSVVMFGIGELQSYAIELHQSANDLGLDANRLPDGFLDISDLEISSDIPELSRIKSATGHWVGPCGSPL
jgi:hypothetical protein